jgi:hypothetical protein
MNAPMDSPTIRIAMWSGPRNISTAMMRSFENRDDTAVVDEPFYAASLAATGADHPMRAEVLASQPQDPHSVVASLLGPVPGGRSVFYQKHMTHHMQPGFPVDWTADVVNAFLIRDPVAVLASYTQKWDEVSLEAIGLPRQVELFEREAERLGHAPPVIAAADVLKDPRATLSALCAACGIPFKEAMLAWPAGKRDSDGVWAPAWYDAVERSTGFGPPKPEPSLDGLRDDLRPIAEIAQPLYDRLAKHALKPTDR